jgi:hypothetical protein
MISLLGKNAPAKFLKFARECSRAPILRFLSTFLKTISSFISHTILIKFQEQIAHTILKGSSGCNQMNRHNLYIQINLLPL